MKTIILSLILTASAMAQNAIIYNPDGSISTIVPKGNGGWTIYDGNGGITTIVPDRGNYDSHNDPDFNYQKYPTWGNRWSPLDNPDDSGPK